MRVLILCLVVAAGGCGGGSGSGSVPVIPSDVPKGPDKMEQIPPGGEKAK